MDASESSGEDEGMLIRLESSTHVAALTKSFEQLFLNEQMVDITLVTDEGQFIHAHKIVLASGSQYFKNIIENASKLPSSHHGTSSMIICMSDIKYAHLYPLIKYVYTGRVDIPQSDLKPLVKTAFRLKITGLYEEEEDENDNVEAANENGNSNGGPDLGLENYIKEEQEDEEDIETDDVEDFAFPGEAFVTDGPSTSSVTSTSTSRQPVSIHMDPDTAERLQVEDSLVFGTQQQQSGAVNTSRSISENLPYHCNCGKNYKCSKSLWRHRRYTCTASAKKVTFVCKTCFKVFSRSDNLKRHSLVAHHINS